MPGWSGRVTIRPGDDGFAYVPGEVLIDVSDPNDIPKAVAVLGSKFCDDDFSDVDAKGYVRLTYSGDIPAVVARLRAAGLIAQPNHVFFADSDTGPFQANPVYASPVYASSAYANPVYASPVYASPVYASPVYASSAYANPVYASPVYASPAYANPVYASGANGVPGSVAGGCAGCNPCAPTDPCLCEQVQGGSSLVDPSPILADRFYPEAIARRYQATGVRASNAVPTYPASASVLSNAAKWDEAPVRIAVLDTGWPAEGADGNIPPGVVFEADDEPHRQDVPDSDIADRFLDPAAGHGMFIAGLINQYAPKAAVLVVRVLSGFGDGNESDIATEIDKLVARDAADRPHIISLSFGTYAPEAPDRLSKSIAGAIGNDVVVVASAGNDGVPNRSYPGGYPDVVSVGALDQNGRPAAFSNWGEWVRACAPGVDVASAFWQFTTRTPGCDGIQDEFEHWALWSGTSFAAPIVAAHLANTMIQQHNEEDPLIRGPEGPAAVTFAIDNPRLIRLPCYGTVINPPSNQSAL